MQRIRRYIEAGDVYQVNLCRLLTAPLPEVADPLALAALLAAGNPAPHQGLLQLPDDWIVTASPGAVPGQVRRQHLFVTDQGHHAAG